MANRVVTRNVGRSRVPASLTAEFVGRDREMKLLKDAMSRPPALVLVEGEAGVGKSRLMREWLASYDPGLASVLVGVCPPLREPFTLGPVVDALRQATKSLGGLRLTALAGALRPLFPEWESDLPAAPEPLGDATATRHRLFRALTELMASLRISVLVIEDVHWADEATLEFLLFLASREPRDVSLALTYRPEDLHPGSLLLRLSSRGSAGSAHARVLLSRLEMGETVRMISSMLDGTAVSASFGRFLHDRTEGLPLAIEESVRLLHDRADLIRQGGMWMRRGLEEIAVPATIRDSVLERTQRLSPGARSLLQAAAVLAEGADETRLSVVSELSDDEMHVCLAEALDSGLLFQDLRGRLKFRHRLISRAVEEAIPNSAWRRLHLIAGCALEDQSPRPTARLAHLFRQAGETSKWLSYAEQGADVAAAAGDGAGAATLLGQLIIDAELSAPVVVGLVAKLDAAVSGSAVDRELVRRVINRLADVICGEDATDVQRAVLRSARGYLLLRLGEKEAGRAEIEAAVGSGLEHNPTEAAHAMILLGWPRTGPWPAAVHSRWLRRGSELISRITNPRERLVANCNRTMALLLLGDQSGWQAAAELPHEAASPGEASVLATAHSNIGRAAMLWGRYADAAKWLTAARHEAQVHAFGVVAHWVAVAEVHLDWMTGQWTDLRERAEALTDVDELDAAQRLEAGLVAELVHASTHSRPAGCAQLRRVLVETARLGLVDACLEGAAALARELMLQGRVDEALQVTDHHAGVIARKGIWVWATELAPMRVLALVTAGRSDEAKHLTERYARWLRGREMPAGRAAVTMCRAFLADGRMEHIRAARLFGNAAAAWEGLPRPYEALLARERQAHCLLAAGLAAGLEALTEVFSGLTRLGARHDADRVAASMRERRIPVPRERRVGRPSYGMQLSPRELEVVRLVITGRTNQEIARILHLSAKTVARHVDAAMRKLNAPSRTALAVAALDAGVAADPLGGATR